MPGVVTPLTPAARKTSDHGSGRRPEGSDEAGQRRRPYGQVAYPKYGSSAQPKDKELARTTERPIGIKAEVKRQSRLFEL